jgi:hypothetical protein
MATSVVALLPRHDRRIKLKLSCDVREPSFLSGSSSNDNVKPQNDDADADDVSESKNDDDDDGASKKMTMRHVLFESKAESTHEAYAESLCTALESRWADQGASGKSAWRLPSDGVVVARERVAVACASSSSSDSMASVGEEEEKAALSAEVGFVVLKVLEESIIMIKTGPQRCRRLGPRCKDSLRRT